MTSKNLAAMSVALLLMMGCGPEMELFENEEDADTGSALGEVVRWVYRDALDPAWADWSWASRNLANGSPVAVGTRSIAVRFGGWQGLYFNRQGYSVQDATHLIFRVHGGSAYGAARIRAKARLNGAWSEGVEIGAHCEGGAIAANRWVRCRVPVGVLGVVGGRLDALVFQENAGRSFSSNMFLDEVGFESPAPAPVPAQAHLYTDALGAGWASWSWGTHNFANTSPVASGSRSIASRYRAWEGLYFRRQGFSVANAADLVLMVHGGSEYDGARLAVRPVVGAVTGAAVELGPRCEGGRIKANAWVRCQVPISALKLAGTTLDGIVIQEWQGRSFSSNVFFDDVRITFGSTASTTGTTTTTGTSGVVWSTNFSQTDPKGFLAMEVEESSANLTFPSPSWAQAGARVMGVTLLEGQRNGHKFMSRFNVGSRKLGIAPMKEAYFRYRVRFPVGMNFAPDGKLPGLSGLPDTRGGWYTSSGGVLRPDSWSARIHWRQAGGYGVPHPYWDAYLYAAEIDGKPFNQWGHQIRFSTGLNGAGQALKVPVGEWITVEFYVRVNTPGKADGAYRGWINGVQGVDLKNIRWTTEGTAEVNQIVAGTFVNNPGNTRTSRIDFDEMSISTSR